MENFNDIKLTTSLEKNMKIIMDLFIHDDTLKYRQFKNIREDIGCCLFFIEGMTDKNIINDNIIRPILEAPFIINDDDYITNLAFNIILTNTVEESEDMENIINKLLTGDSILFVDTFSKVLLISSQDWETRSVEEPSAEKVLKGPREGFTESLVTNISLVRRKIKSKDLKFHYITLGTRTNTKVCICYIENLTPDETINNIIRKVEKIDIDGILDVRYITEFIDDHPFSIFETAIETEKPDVVAGKLLEGRVAILVDGSPMVLTTPTLFIELLMTSDDYYLNYYFASIGRLLRVISFIASISIPALYIALVSYHHELIPTQLLMSIYAARQSVGFPSIVELVLLLFSFEALRESGQRIPGNVSSTIGIVGAIVLGTAAVEARFVSAPIIIIVGLTSITGLMSPVIAEILVILRAILLILSSLLGLYGYLIGMLGLLIFIHSLRSQGILFMENLNSLKPQEIKDTIIRAPWWFMQKRPNHMSEDSKRSNSGG